MTGKPNLFWLEQSMLPEGTGYELFGREHLTILLVIALAIVCLACVFHGSRPENRNKFIKAVSFVPLVTEVCRISFLASVSKMGIGYLPLHLCSMSIWVFPLSVFLPDGRLRTFFTEVSVCTLMPAGLSALLFPDWTMYPVMSFMNLSSFLWHATQVFFPLLLIISGSFAPRLSRFWMNPAFLLMTGLPVYAFDLKFRCNYWFLLSPIPGTPLELIHARTDGTMYMAGLFIFASVMIFIADLLINIVLRIIRRSFLSHNSL